MAKKTRKQKQRAAARRSTPAGTTRVQAPQRPVVDDEWQLGVADTEDIEHVDEPEAAEYAAVDSVPVAGRRRIERVSAVTAQRAVRQGRPPANAAAMFQPLESDDAAIPFDRVPYVPADLRRVGVMAVCMVALIVIAALIVSHVVS
ncbi:MAG TPA: hypothetical protein VNY76_06185 [Candidatus Acidoferrales bacterium]|jgi:hypothetical protein|nr:hypothetical protein [Candidatus Acidoferrales bacterium]